MSIETSTVFKVFTPELFTVATGGSDYADTVASYETVSYPSSAISISGFQPQSIAMYQKQGKVVNFSLVVTVNTAQAVPTGAGTDEYRVRVASQTDTTKQTNGLPDYSSLLPQPEFADVTIRNQAGAYIAAAPGSAQKLLALLGKDGNLRLQLESTGASPHTKAALTRTALSSLFSTASTALVLSVRGSYISA